MNGSVMHRKFLAGAMVFILLCLSLPVNGLAYIDPATTTYIIQIVSAVVITLGITIGVFFGRIRMFVLNARVKTTQWRIKLFSKKRASAPVLAYMRFLSGMQAAPMGKWEALWHDERSYRQRLMTALSLSLGFAFTFVAFGPYEMYALNIASFEFKISEVYSIILIISLLVFLSLGLALSVLRGKVFDVPASLLLGILLAGYIQGNFLNTGLGQLTGDFIDWSQHSLDLALNLLLWLLISLLPLILYYFKQKTWAVIVRGLPLLLVLVQLTALYPLKENVDKHQPDMNHYLSTGGLYEASGGENVIVIILDRLDNTYIDAISGSEPDYFDRLDGFTRFTNNITRYTATFPTVCYMLTRQVHMYESDRGVYMSKAYRTSSFLPGLRESGYGVKMYTQARFSFANAADLVGIADNVSTAKLSVQKTATVKEFMLLSAYRYAPISIKPFVWTSTSRFSQIIDRERDPGPYVMDDAAFYQTLLDKRLSLSEHKKSFSFIHLNGSHAPFTIDVQARAIPANEGSVIGQTKGSFHIVYEYLDQLKALGLYENATIIITGDHGVRANDHQAPMAPNTAGLFVKPKGHAGTPLAYSHAPVSTDNFHATIYEAAGLPHAGLGLTYFEVPPDSQEPRYVYYLLVASEEGPERLLIYEVGANARDFGQWQVIDEQLVTYTDTR